MKHDFVSGNCFVETLNNHFTWGLFSVVTDVYHLLLGIWKLIYTEKMEASSFSETFLSTCVATRRNIPSQYLTPLQSETSRTWNRNRRWWSFETVDCCNCHCQVDRVHSDLQRLFGAFSYNLSTLRNPKKYSILNSSHLVKHEGKEPRRSRRRWRIILQYYLNIILHHLMFSRLAQPV